MARQAAKRPDWSRRLPQSLVIPDVMTLSTLADVRELMRHLPADHRERQTWRHVANLVESGADPVDVSIALRLVLFLERVECRQQ
jgi:hypothetical protein